MHSTDSPKPNRGEIKARYGHYAGLNNDRVRIRVTRDGKTYSHYVDGDPGDPKVQKRSSQICREIQAALTAGTFLEYWERLTGKDGQGKTNKGKSHLQAVDQDYRKYTVPLLELWDQYVEYLTTKKDPIGENYKRKTLDRLVRANLVKANINDLKEAQQLRDWLGKNLKAYSHKRILVQLNACCVWGTKRQFIPDNPFDGMANDIKVSKSSKSNNEELVIKAFTAEERDIIIETFKQSRYYRHYYPLVYFLFFTGCSPNEAQALQWKHIDHDILFEQRVEETQYGLQIRPGTKTEPFRRFPINDQLRVFLDGIKPDNVDPDSFVFPGPRGKLIDQHNFCNRAWSNILKQCGIEYRRPYQMRHTFITLALDKDVNVKDIARLTGNSADVIWKHYASNKRDLVVPEL